MYQQIVYYINGLNQKSYEKYYDTTFTFYIDSDKEKYNKTMFIINLIDNTLREKGDWKK